MFSLQDISGSNGEPVVTEKPDNDANFVEADKDRANDNKDEPSKTVTAMRPPVNTVKRVKKRAGDAQSTSEISQAISQLDNIAKNASQDKAYDQFGKFVACELRSLEPRQAILLQQKIQNLIIESKLNSLDSAVRSHTPEDNMSYMYSLPCDESNDSSTTSYGEHEDVLQNVMIQTFGAGNLI